MARKLLSFERRNFPPSLLILIPLFIFVGPRRKWTRVEMGIEIFQETKKKTSQIKASHKDNGSRGFYIIRRLRLYVNEERAYARPYLVAQLGSPRFAIPRLVLLEKQRENKNAARAMSVERPTKNELMRWKRWENNVGNMNKRLTGDREWGGKLFRPDLHASFFFFSTSDYHPRWENPIVNKPWPQDTEIGE